MPLHVRHIAEGVQDAEQEWVRVVRTERRRWHDRVYRGRVRFDEEVRRRHRRFKQSVPAFLRDGSVGNLLTTPVIYSLALPFMLLDLWVIAYQTICFPIYGITRVRRGSYVELDRHKLAYLNVIEKANCLYCTYANGVVGFVREVTARTEQYWCPIKHARAVAAPHDHYQLFLDYGDAEGYRRRLPRLRKALRGRTQVRASRARSARSRFPRSRMAPR
jgi:hypothetical protein